MTLNDILDKVEGVSEEEIRKALIRNERERKLLLKLIQAKRLQESAMDKAEAGQ